MVGRAGEWIDSLTVITNTGNVITAGGLGGDEQDTAIPQTIDMRYAVVSIGGGLSDHLDNFDATYVDLTKFSSD